MKSQYLDFLQFAASAPARNDSRIKKQKMQINGCELNSCKSCSIKARNRNPKRGKARAIAPANYRRTCCPLIKF